MSRCLAVAAMLAAAPFAVAGAEEVTVYTAIEADQLKDYEGAFEAANPNVDIRWVRDSIGIVTAKLLAEKSNPRADVVFGLAATSVMLLQKEGMLDAYAGRAGQGEAADARPRRPALVGRHGCRGLGLLLQHDRGRGQEAAKAGWLG
jgi:iron(III) transport system substrate-binding protein